MGRYGTAVYGTSVYEAFPTAAVASGGALLQMLDRATHLNWVSLTEVLDIKGPPIKGMREDATSHSSGGWEEKINVLKSGGKIAFDMNFIAADESHHKVTGLLGAALQQTRESFALTFPDATGFLFGAFVDAEFAEKVKGKLTVAIELDISGELTAL